MPTGEGKTQKKAKQTAATLCRYTCCPSTPPSISSFAAPQASQSLEPSTPNFEAATHPKFMCMQLAAYQALYPEQVPSRMMSNGLCSILRVGLRVFQLPGLLALQESSGSGRSWVGGGGVGFRKSPACGFVAEASEMVAHFFADPTAGSVASIHDETAYRIQKCGSVPEAWECSL